MSALVFDHIVVIERIIEVLKDNDKIFEQASPIGKLRKILFAESDDGIQDDSTPYAWVATNTVFQLTLDSIGSALKDYFQTQAEYIIAIIAQKKAGTESQKELYKFVDLITKALKNNPKLEDPKAPGTDNKTFRLNIRTVERFNPGKGLGLDAVRIICRYQIGLAWQLELVTQGITLDLISKPLDTTENISDTDLEDDGTISETLITDLGLLDVETQLEPADRAVIDGLISGGLEHTVRLKKGGVVTLTKTVFFKQIREPTPIDNIERSIVAMKVIA